MAAIKVIGKMKKSLIAILISVVSGIVVWLITGPGAERVIAPEKRARIEIINLQHSKEPYLEPREKYELTVTLHNAGNDTARQVKACLDIYEWTEESVLGSSDLVRFEDAGKIDRILSLMACSKEVALLPGQSRDLVLNCSVNEEGNYFGAVRAFSYVNDLATRHEEAIVLGVWERDD